jgi:hypothetical protein
MAATGGTGRRSRKGVGKKGLAAKAKLRPIGRPPRLAHLVPGSDRQQRRAQSIQAAALEAAPPASRAAETALESHQAPPASAKLRNVLCLPNPEWLPHELMVSGPQAALARFREAASGPGCIPWVIDYQRVEEDWVFDMLTPPPAERGISVEGARILARQLRDRLELQDMQAAEVAFASAACPLDLHALVPIPDRILSLGPNDPNAVNWLWENWGTTWALRGVEEIASARETATRSEKSERRYRFWSADWTPWRALSSIQSRWPEMTFQIAVRAVSE